MMMLRILPRPLRRRLIDAVYGAKDRRGLVIYLGLVWVVSILIALAAIGALSRWPAEAQGRVVRLAEPTCADLPETDAREEEPSNQSAAAGNRGRAKARVGRETSCTGLGADDGLFTYLRTGGVGQDEPPRVDTAPDGPLRQWIDANLCRLGGVEGSERAAAAWHIWRGAGECGFGDRVIAQMPAVIGLGRWLGLALTVLLLAGGAFLLARHTYYAPLTRTAYRRLYGSDHKAPL